MTSWQRALRSVVLMSALVLTLLVTASCGDDDNTAASVAKAGAMEVANAYAHGVMDGGAVYFTMKNTGDTDDTLIGATAEAAGNAALHETVAGEGTTMRMQPIDEIEIPAGGIVTLEPGGYHVMLMDLIEPLTTGDTVEVRLTFQQAGSVSIQATATSFSEPDDGMEDGSQVTPTATEVPATEPPAQTPTQAAPTATEVPATQPPAPTAAKRVIVDVPHWEWEMSVSPNTAPAGTVTFNAINEGAIPHNLRLAKTDLAPDALPVGDRTFVVDEEQLDILAASRDLDIGESEQLTVELEPGNYVLFCNIPAHYQTGLYAGFSVE